MSENDDYEEEFIVYADFGTHLTSSEISDDNLDIKIIGIDADHPIIEANGKIFKGTYNFSLGTHVLFEKNENPPISDPLYDKYPDEIYKLLSKTNKILELKRIFLETDNSQENIDNNQEEESLEELKSRLAVTTTYFEALNMLLPRGSNLRDEYLKKRLSTCEDDEEPNNSANEDPDYIPQKDITD